MALKLVENMVKVPLDMAAYTETDGVVETIQESIGPKDIDGYYANIVRIAPDLPQDRIREMQTAMMATQAERPLLSRETAFTEILHGESWSQEQQRILIDMALNSPELQKLLAFESLRKLGYIDDILEALKAAGPPPSAAPPGQAPGQMGPYPGPPEGAMPVAEVGVPSQVMPPVEQGIPPVPPADMGAGPVTQREVTTGARR
jgi:hypothetical protein